MSVIDLAQAIEEGRKALEAAKSLFDSELKKMEALKASHAAELAKASEAAHAAEAIVSAHAARLRDMSNQMLSELGHNVSDDMKSIILNAQKNRKSF